MRLACVCALLAAVMAVQGCGPKGPTAIVSLNCTIEPKEPLPEQYLNIAVRNADVSGDTEEFDQSKWSVMTADLVQYHLQAAAEKHDVPLKLVDREHVKLALEEKDLAAAGITDSGDEVAQAALKGASAIITSKVTIKIDKQAGKGRTIDAVSAIGWARGGGGSVHTTEVDKESRAITAQCQFQLKDAATNEVIVPYSGKPTQHFSKTKTSPFFGGSKTEAHMTPRDKIIGEIVEQQVQAFVQKFLPVDIETSVTVKPGKSESSVAGVRALVVDDYETALENFKQAISEDTDDHRSLFGAGVACEKLRQFDQALKYYKQALSLETKDQQYNEAVRRVSPLT